MTEFVTDSVFAQIAALLVIASVLGVLGILLRQPLIVSFIAVGLIAGPSVLDLVHAEEYKKLLRVPKRPFRCTLTKGSTALGATITYYYNIESCG